MNEVAFFVSVYTKCPGGIQESASNRVIASCSLAAYSRQVFALLALTDSVLMCRLLQGLREWLEEFHHVFVWSSSTIDIEEGCIKACCTC